MPRRRSWLWRAGHVHAGHRAAHEGADVQVLPLSGRRVRDDRMRRLVYPSRTRAELGSGLLHQGFSPSGRGVPAHRRGSRRRFRRRALRRRITSAPSACSCPLLVASCGSRAGVDTWPCLRVGAGAPDLHDRVARIAPVTARKLRTPHMRRRPSRSPLRIGSRCRPPAACGGGSAYGRPAGSPPEGLVASSGRAAGDRVGERRLLAVAVSARSGEGV